MFLRCIFISILLCISCLSFGQAEISRTSDWKIFFENEQITFYSRYTECIRPQDGIYAEYVMLKAVNKSSEPVVLTWYTDTYFDGGCTNCDHSLRDRKRTLQLKPGETVEGDCAPGLNTGLEVFSKWLKMPNTRELTTVKVTEISTSFIH